MAGSIYQLTPISADTNAGTGAMAGASQSFSHAGTVFGELRKSILDEEQRAIENAYKQQVFDENVRQFGEHMGLERDQFAFNQDKFAKEFGLNERQFEELMRHNRATEATAAQNAKFANLGAQIQLKKWEQQLAQEADIKQIASSLTAGKNASEQQMKAIEEKLKDTSLNQAQKDELTSQYNLLKNNHQVMFSASGLDQQMRDLVAARHGIILDKTQWSAAAKDERDRIEKAAERNFTQFQKKNEEYSKFQELMDKDNLTPGQFDIATNFVDTAVKKFPDLKPADVYRVLRGEGTYNAYWNWNGQNALNSTFWGFGNNTPENFIADPDNAQNYYYKKLKQAADSKATSK